MEGGWARSATDVLQLHISNVGVQTHVSQGYHLVTPPVAARCSSCKICGARLVRSAVSADRGIENVSCCVLSCWVCVVSCCVALCCDAQCCVVVFLLVVLCRVVQCGVSCFDFLLCILSCRVVAWCFVLLCCVLCCLSCLAEQSEAIKLVM